jgi:hypothetical protein
VDEIVAFEKQGMAGRCGEGMGDAIADKDKGVRTERDPWWAGRVSPAPVMPPAIVSRSASFIRCGVSSACRRQPTSEIIIGEM